MDVGASMSVGNMHVYAMQEQIASENVRSEAILGLGEVYLIGYGVYLIGYMFGW